LLRRRPNPALVHLPIARLDPEPFPVRLLHPVDPPGGDPPVRVDPCVALPPAMPVHPPRPLHADPDRGLVLLAVLEGVAEPPALLLLLEDVRPAGAFGMIGLAAVADNWHEERPPRPLQVADDRHAVEAAVQQQQPGLQPRLAHQEQQLLEYLLEAL